MKDLEKSILTGFAQIIIQTTEDLDQTTISTALEIQNFVQLMINLEAIKLMS